jgi:hypothetical protein
MSQPRIEVRLLIYRKRPIMTNDDIFGIGDDAYDDTDVEST